jgi:hypothetical protein
MTFIEQSIEIATAPSKLHGELGVERSSDRADIRE